MKSKKVSDSSAENLQGRFIQITAFAPIQTKVILDVQTLQSGVYFVKVKTNKHSYQQKIIIAHE